MKLSHIIGLVVIAVAFATILSMNTDASSYVDFAEARSMAAEGSDKKVHVVGMVAKRNGQMVMFYDPKQDPNYFTFQLVDNKQQPCDVVYANPKPQDFERSEQVVVIGNMQGNTFVADKILMKCPSKYQDNEFREAPKVNPGESPNAKPAGADKTMTLAQ